MRIFLQPPSTTASWPTRLLGSLLLPLLALCAALDAQAVLGVGATFTYEGINYKVLKGGTTVSTQPYQKYESGGFIAVNGNPYAEGDIVIPATVYDKDGNGYTVVSIGNGSFGIHPNLVNKDYLLTSVTLPPTVTVIENDAFAHQLKLEAVYGGSGVTEIGLRGFLDAPIKDISNFSSLKTIGASAFSNTQVTSISLPETVTTIGSSAFYRCNSLRYVLLPSSVTSIGDTAFGGNEGGLDTFILRSAPTMGKEMFKSTVVHRRAILEGTTISGFGQPTANSTYNPWSASPVIAYPADAVISDGWIISSDMTKVYLAPVDVDDATAIPAFVNIKCVGPYAFSWSKLSDLKLPAGVEELEIGAFASCQLLESVDCGTNLSKVGSYAFFSCPELKVINFAEGLKEIGMSAFSSCPKLDDVSLPQSLASIGTRAFSASGLKNLRLPENTTLENAVFQGCPNLVSVEWPANIKNVPNQTFQNCPALENVDFLDNASVIGDNVFEGCVNLRQVFLAGNIYKVGEAVFKGCTNLQAVVFGPKVTEKGYKLFEDCPALARVAVPQSIGFVIGSPFTVISYPTDGLIEDGCVYNRDKSGLYYVSIFKEGKFTIPTKLSRIYKQAALGCDRLTEVFVEHREFGFDAEPDAFKDCTGLERVSVSNIDDWLLCAFHNEYANPMDVCGKLYIQDEEVTDLILTLPEDRNQICSFLFVNGKNIRSVTLPENCRYIGQGAFKDCISIETMVFPDEVYQIGNSSFEGCSSLTDVTFGKSVGDIAAKAFGSCPKLKNINAIMPLPRTAEDAFDSQMSQRILTAPTEYVLDYAITLPWSRMGRFACPDGKVDLAEISGLRYVYNTGNNTAALRKYDYTIEDVEIPARINQSGAFCNVIKMADGAFENNTSLRTLSIGRNLKVIPDNAFNGCSNLQSVTFNENSVLNSVGKSAFNDCTAMKECWLPQTVAEIGQGAFKNCSSLERVFTGNAVTWIPNETFYGCASMKELTLGGALTSIGNDAFRGCASLTSLMLPPTLQTVGTSAFACEDGSLKEVKMGFSLYYLYDKVFEGQTGLSDIYITRDTPPSAYATTFANYKATLHVVPGTVDVYAEAAPCWFNFYDNGNVKEMVPVKEVKLSETSFDSPKPGDTFQLSATVSPANATMTEVYWMSTNPRVATVTSDGLVTIQDTFAAPLAFVAYDGEDWEEEPDASYCEIRAYSMFGNIPQAVCTIGDPSGVEEIGDESGSERFDMNLPYDVYTLQGAFVGRGLDGLAGGLYILRQGKNVRKVMLR